MKEYKHFSLEERKELFVMKNEGKNVVQIAKALRRHRSSIERELMRNTLDTRIGYLPDEADKLAQTRKAKHGTKLDRNPTLKAEVVQELRDGWSPEVIAGRKKQQASPLWVCHETIYQFVYSDEGKKLGLFHDLLKARPKRGKLFGRKVKKVLIPERVSIHDCPKNIETRDEFGHLEGDLTFMLNNQSSNIGVVVERKSRYTQLMLNTSKQLTVVIQNMFNKLAQLPAVARKSMTLDNGLEFARHTLLKKYMGMETYFCDKHSPWQKGQVEQMNVMLHRYLPKNTNLKEVSYEQIELIQNKLNSRPRKCLGFKTPAEAFYEQISRVVAL